MSVGLVHSLCICRYVIQLARLEGFLRFHEVSGVRYHACVVDRITTVVSNWHPDHQHGLLFFTAMVINKYMNIYIILLSYYVKITVISKV